jgi:hypothetical protein
MMADVSEKSYEFLWWPMSTQPLSLLDRERISIHCSPGEPVETLAGCDVVEKSCELMLVNSCWKSVIWKGAVCIDGGISMVVVVMMLKGAPMDMEFMRACDVLMLKSTGDPCSWVPNVVLKSRFCWA